MTQAVYDIAPGDIAAVDWLSCSLAMEVNDQYFLYAVLQENRRLIALKYHALATNGTYPLRDQLGDIIKSDEILQQSMQQTALFYNLPESCLVPEAYFNEHITHPVIDFMYGDLRKGVVLNEPVPGGQLLNVFRIPQELHELLQANYPWAKVNHYFSAWKRCMENAGAAGTSVQLTFYPNNLLAAVTIDGVCQLMRSLQYQSPEDVAYHVLNIYYQFDLSQDDLPVQIGGLVDMDSAVIEELLKYFQWIQTTTLPDGFEAPDAFREWPPHFFSPFLRLASCVS